MAIAAFQIPDFTPMVQAVKSAVGTTVRTAKDWTLWFGREVIHISGKAFELGKTGLGKLIQLLQVIWKEVKPYLHKTIEFLRSDTGIFGLGIMAALLIGKMALSYENDKDKTPRYALGLLSVGITFFSAVFGVQHNVVGKWT